MSRLLKGFTSKSVDHSLFSYRF